MRSERVAYFLAWTAAVLAAVASAAGLFVSSLYRDVPFWVEQTRGIDLATLFLAVPLLLIGLLTSRRSQLGRLAVVGVLLYFVYNYLIYTTSVAMNGLAIVYIAILGLSIWSLALMLMQIELAGGSDVIADHLARRSTGIFLLLVTILFGLLWLSQIAGFTLSGTVPTDLARAKLPANPVYALDLGLFLPLAAVAGVARLRRSQAAVFAFPMLIWIVLTSAGILGGFIFEARAGEAVPLPVAAVIGLFAVVAAALALAPLMRPAP